MAQLVFKESVTADCWITLLGDGISRLDPVPDPPAPTPAIQSGPTGIAINARCFDFGKVRLEIWAGDLVESAAPWATIFDGELEARSEGLRAGTAYHAVFRLDVSPGKHRVRAEVTRDRNGYVNAVRLIFPDTIDLHGEVLNQ